jgi:hypothetical protein
MTLTILDPRSSNKVTICVEDAPAYGKQPQPRW